MSCAPSWRAWASGLAVAVAFVALVASAPSSRGTTVPVHPDAAMTVTVVLDKASYLSGDTATASAIVYRTPGPSNYTYGWIVRDSVFRVLETIANGTSTFTYLIPLNYTGTLYVDATVDDGQGLTVTSRRGVGVLVAVMALRLDRGEFNPGETITASYSVTSHVILRPTYDYDVFDSAATSVRNGTTNESSFSFQTPVPASRTYAFFVTAREGSNSTQGLISIGQVSGALLGVTFDKTSYSPGETIHAHLTVIPRGTTSLPVQFRWSLSFGLPFFGSVSVSAITTVPEVDLALPIPKGVGDGDILLFATESNTGTSRQQTVHVGTTNALWSTELAGVPLFAVLLGLLLIFMLVAILGLWRRISFGGPPPAPKVPPPSSVEGAPRAPPVVPMSILCQHCGKPIELTTSKRPIEVMCPSCGETQLVS